jgi:ABC-type multidrug transport system ATPase subunit
MVESNIVILIQILVHLSNYAGSMNYELIKNLIFKLLRKELEINDYEKYIEVFDFYFRHEDIVSQKNLSFDKFNQLCKKLAEELPIRERIIILLYLIRFQRLFITNPYEQEKKSLNLEQAIKIVAIHFKIKPEDLGSLNAFVNNEIHNVTNKENLIIAGGKSFLSDIRFLERKGLNGLIKFYYIKSLNVFLFFLQGTDDIRLNTIDIIPYSIYFFTKSSLIIGNKIDTIYFNDLLKLLLFEKNELKLNLTASNISLRYHKSENGIKPFDFFAESGQFIGIMGKSGSGKTTLMSLLTGYLKPTTGFVKINGVSISENLASFSDVIGYVPQHDTLISELTAYQNLFYYTKLWNNSLKDYEIDSKINSILEELELGYIKDRVVSTEFQKCISGGERKRLNLALELIRNPKVLFADEPTSGLSSSDSETLIRLLHEQVLIGRLVVINIHQPSSAVFKSFDKVLIIDTGGYPVYLGNPMLAAETLAGYSNPLNSYTGDYSNYGDNSAEGVFQILEQKKVDKYGVYTHERKILPKEWYSFFVENTDEIQPDAKNRTDFLLEKPHKQNLFLQWRVFLERNLLIKKNDIQYIIISLLTTPLLALILAFLCRNSTNITGGYNFNFNNNIPSFIFISVLVALFTGMLSSAEEIHRDKLVNARESILFLSGNSYLLSKISFLLLLSAVQMFLYVIVVNSVLEIDGMFITYWLMLWMLSCTANLIGLILSTSFKSVVTIYIFIPFILIPQILLSGTVINYKDINRSISSAEHVPVIGDIMPSRWAFEAIAVNQFKEKSVDQGLYNIELKISNNSYLTYYLIPDIVEQINTAESKIRRGEKLSATEEKLIMDGVARVNHWRILDQKTPIPVGVVSSVYLKSARDLLENLHQEMLRDVEYLQNAKDKLLLDLSKAKTLVKQSNQNLTYTNSSLSKILLNSNEINPFLKINGKYVRLFEPIYDIPRSKIGRAQLYAPFKRIGATYIDTYWFNFFILLFMNMLLYVPLYLLFRFRSVNNNMRVNSK